VVAGTPPATSMAQAGLMGHVKPYPLMVDTRISNPAEMMIKDVASGVIDVAAVWGPVAGYYAGKMQPKLTVAPLTKEKVSRMTYRITMGVRPADQNWKRALNRVISENQAEINHLLQSFGVPLLDEQDKPITD
jgi:ABC-type amino acid transport substrate-binding protein